MIEKAAEALRGARRALVTSHLNPDGDAIGSILALCGIMKDAGIEAIAFHPDAVPGEYEFLSGADSICHDVGIKGEFDLLVVLDVGERERIAKDLPAGVAQATIVVIDHHAVHGDLGDVVYRRNASSVGEMVIEVARHLGWDVSTEAAECAYAAILSDTGSFRYSSTSAESLEIASWLVSRGVDPWKVASNIYESWPFERVRLLGAVLATLEQHHDGALSTLCVTDEMLAEIGATPEMTDGFVNYGRMVAGAEVAALMREKAPGLFRISFRSRGSVDVALVAGGLGGGGHRNASGASAKGDLEAVKAQIVRLVGEALEEL